MTDKAISPLRRRLIEDMAIRRLGPKTQHHYISHVKRLADFLGQSADKAIAEFVHRYQLWLASIGTTVPTVNVSATALRFFFRVTLERRDLAEEVVSTREPRRLPIVLSPEEVGRLLASATNIKHKAALSLTYATGLRSSEAVSLKLTDIDSDRMVIRVEQGKGKKDRYVILLPNLLELLRDWWRVARKKGWTIGVADRLCFPHFPSELGKRGMLAFADIPTGTTINKGIDIEDLKSRGAARATAMTTIGADIETGGLHFSERLRLSHKRGPPQPVSCYTVERALGRPNQFSGG